MLMSWNWLNSLVSIPASLKDVAEKLTVTGCEIEGITYPCEELSGVWVAKIISLKPHPNKSSLFVVQLDYGKGEACCVTAATNLKEGDLIPYAPPQAVLADGTVLSERDFDGVVSQGMMLSAEEIGLPDIADEFGILRLPDDAPVGADLKKYLRLDDAVLDVSVTPNRGDLLSALGIAREIYALFPDAVGRKNMKNRPDEGQHWPMDFRTPTLKDGGCRRYLLGLATDVKIGPSPLPIRILLSLMGMRPISNVVDATNLVMLLMGQPLHAFDLDRLPEREITVRSAKDGEYMTTLDGKKRVLDSLDLLITSNGAPIALAGVMGGESAEICDTTKNVVIESASFDPVRVSRTSRRLGLNSEASFRYARGVDPELVYPAMACVLSLLKKWGAAHTEWNVLAATNDIPASRDVALTREKLQRILLWDDLEESSRILNRLGFIEKEKKDNIRKFQVPSYRPDVSIEEDLVEEVARIRGYNDMPSRLPRNMSSRGDRGALMELRSHLRQIALARGYVEVITYSFLPPSYTKFFCLSEDDRRAHLSALSNPLSTELSVMRTFMIPGLLNALASSLRTGWREAVRIFEQGRVFLQDAEAESGIKEEEHIAGLVYPGRDIRKIHKDSDLEDFLSVKGDVEAIISSRGYACRFIPGTEPFGHCGQTAHVLVNGNRVGYLLRLKPSLERELDLGSPIYVFELALEPLLTERQPVFVENPPYPAVHRDISLIVSQEKLAGDVEMEIRKAAGELLWNLRLFDVYVGKGIPEGTRSLAFSLAYRNPARTLSDEEVDAVHNKVREEMVVQGYTLR